MSNFLGACVQGGEVDEKGLDVGVRVVPDFEPGGLCLANGLVVDVGQVHHLGDVVAEKLQGASQDVLEEEAAEVADVGEVVDRRSAGVHAHMARLDRLEVLELAVQRVVEAQRNVHIASGAGLYARIAAEVLG